MEFLSREGLDYFWKQIVAKFVTHDESQKFVTKEDGKGLSSEDYTSEEKTKLAALSTTAEANQNAFGIVNTKSGSVNTTLNAVEEVSALNFEAGANITLAVNAATNTIKIIGAEAPEAPEASLENLGISATATEINHIAGATSNIQTQLNNRFDIVGSGTSIAANTDLNTLTTPGNYSCVSGNVGSLTNCPITEGGFKLVVINGYTVEYKHQFLYWGANSYIYYRTRNSNGTWKNWVLLNNVSLANAEGTLPISKGGTGATTAAEALTKLGAAPSGYGLGTTGTYCANANNANKSGWYGVDVNTTNIPSGAAGVMFVKTLSTENGTDIYQTITSGVTAIRRYYSSWAGAWQPWEYINPPMTAGVEYRTTERINGKAVYKKRDSNGVIMYRLDGESSWTTGLPGAAPASHTHDYVPTSRTINGKALSSNITLSASDVSAVPTSRTINGKALSSNITLSASDVSAVPTSRTINGKALSSNITLSASDVSARSNTWVPALTDCSGTLSIAKGGTGATDINSARASLKTACSYNIYDKPTGYDNVWYGWALTNYYASPTSANTWGDAYYMLVSSDGTLRVGTQLNNATSITWSKVYSENYKPTPDAIGAAPATHTHPEYYNINSVGTAIAENADLNTYTTPGTYYAVAATAAKLSNSPSTSGFRLVVERGYSTGRYIQRALGGSTSNAEWVRYYSGSAWGTWQRTVRANSASSAYPTYLQTYSSYAATLGFGCSDSGMWIRAFRDGEYGEYLYLTKDSKNVYTYARGATDTKVSTLYGTANIHYGSSTPTGAYTGQLWFKPV